jgi:hypothetical protein
MKRKNSITVIGIVKVRAGQATLAASKDLTRVMNRLAGPEPPPDTLEVVRDRQPGSRRLLPACHLSLP